MQGGFGGTCICFYRICSFQSILSDDVMKFIFDVYFSSYYLINKIEIES